jgi:hypothetical protein
MKTSNLNTSVFLILSCEMGCSNRANVERGPFGIDVRRQQKTEVSTSILQPWTCRMKQGTAMSLDLEAVITSRLLNGGSR